MFVELHLIQNFAPSCLNRDDTNAPKDCEFGGYRRGRISSQCLKRAIRSRFGKDLLLPADKLAQRTKRLVDELTKRVVEAGKDATEAHAAAVRALASAGLAVKDDGKTQYLLFLAESEIARLADLVVKHWKALSQTPESSETDAGGKKSGKDKKKEAKGAAPPEVTKALDTVLDGGKAADLALFGRMLADLPEKNIDAASQVAHALSTNKVSMEMDFYTAVDDLKPEDTAGADMMGTVEFNSSCFYRYANLDLGQLTKNLGGDVELTRQTVEAFLRASVAAIPTGKQNSMAAQNPPSFIFAVVRDSGLWSLANAFVQPVRPTHDRSLVQRSIEELDAYWGRLVGMYGDCNMKAKAVCLLDEADLKHLAEHKVGKLDSLIAKVTEVLP
jgi:CRISPR system Cascade subunit CasC